MGRHRIVKDGLPANVYLKSGTYYFVTQEKPRRWINIGKEESAIEFKLAQLAATHLAAERATPSYGPHIATAYNKCKGGAVSRGIEFKITRKNIDNLFVASGGRCQLTGIEFSNDVIGKANSRPWAASIDRIDSAKGYIPNNIRLVCVCVNMALGAWGDEVFLKMIEQGYKNLNHAGLVNSKQ